jgi:hypothetical protein
MKIQNVLVLTIFAVICTLSFARIGHRQPDNYHDTFNYENYDTNNNEDYDATGCFTCQKVMTIVQDVAELVCDSIGPVSQKICDKLVPALDPLTFCTHIHVCE